MNRILVFFALFSLSGCLDFVRDDPNQMSDPNVEGEFNTPNILLIIADDLGKDALNGYVEGEIKPITPHLDRLREDGLVFSNFWSNPTCTPTRSTILTGKYAIKTGMTRVGDSCLLYTSPSPRD